MNDLVEFLWNWSFSLISLFIHFSQFIRKTITMASPTAAASPPTRLPWKRLAESHLLAQKRSKDRAARAEGDVNKGSILKFEGFQEENLYSQKDPEENLPSWVRDFDQATDEYPSGNPRPVLLDCAAKGRDFGVRGGAEDGVVAPRKVRKRPARIVVPEYSMGLGFGDVQVEDLAEKEFEFEGNGYWVASRRGNRQVMEDGYGVMTDINGDSKQAYFGVFDGHGGRAAVDFVSEKLGKNILTALDELDKVEGDPELAIRAGYLTTDKEFLRQDVSSGACVATVLLKDGELNVANVGDCRVVISREGVANALTNDHRAGRQDERMRIESSGGYVGCHNGIWRVQNSLAVSRAIGDAHLKEWVIAEPETAKLLLTSDCDFLIMASDGLWDKVSNQEAVDVVMKHKDSIRSCKSLVDISFSRGSRDDITVMVVDLQRFMNLR